MSLAPQRSSRARGPSTQRGYRCAYEESAAETTRAIEEGMPRDVNHVTGSVDFKVHY